MSETILVSEIFGPTIQGEGALIGRPTVFVRTGGCDFRCSWCDTLHSVLPSFREQWKRMTVGEVTEAVCELAGGKPMLVTLSGGNPALHPLGKLIRMGHARALTFALETQASLARSWFADLDYLVLSPKPPSSGMPYDAGALAECIAAAGETTQMSLKIVVFDHADYLFARRIADAFPAIPLYLQVGNSSPADALGGADERAADHGAIAARLEWLLAQVTADGWTGATILPQIHVLLWGNKRGV